MKFSPIINAMNGGEWTPLLDGRTDIQGYSASAYKLENWIPLIQGPATRRGGTGFVRQVKDTTDRTWLMPFVLSRTDSVQIEFGDVYCRFYVNRAAVVTGSTKTITGITAASPCVVSATAHGYSNGQDVFITGVVGMTEVNNRWFRVASANTNDFELTTIHGDNVVGSSYTAYSSGGTIDKPYEIVSPYNAAALAGENNEFNLDYVQSGDVIYITDRNGVLAPRLLTRSSAISWAFTVFAPDDGPWLDLNATTTTVYAGAATGSMTLTASVSIFTAADVGSLIRIDQEKLTATAPWKAATAYTAGNYVRSEGKEYLAANTASSGTSIPAHTSGTVTDGGVQWTYVSSGYGIARITAQAGTTATVTVLTTFPQTIVGSGNVSTFWRRGSWSESNGYPTCVTFFRERIAFGQLQNVNLSVSAGFDSFAIDSFGEVLAESAISVTIQSSEANEVLSLTEGTVLAVSTIGAEFTIDAPATSQPFGPNNIRVIKQTAYGSRPIRPVRIGENVLFVQGSGLRLRSMQYSVESNNFIAPDMTVRAEHITQGGITQVARQESPYQTLWAVRGDGTLLSFAFDQDQQVRGWARHTIGTVECVSVIPSPDGTRDDVWLVVKRTINGATRRYIEYIRREFQVGDAQEDVTYVDCGLTYDGVAVDTIYGFDHLEGETVRTLADGARVPDVVVANGEVVQADDASVMQIGLAYESIYASNRLDGGAGDGTAQGKTKRITDVAFRVISTLGGSAGPSYENRDDISDLNYRSPATLMGTPNALFTGDALLSWPGGYETDARIWFVTDEPYPATIAAILPQATVQESR